MMPSVCLAYSFGSAALRGGASYTGSFNVSAHTTHTSQYHKHVATEKRVYTTSTRICLVVYALRPPRVRTLQSLGRWRVVWRDMEAFEPERPRVHCTSSQRRGCRKQVVDASGI